jgi:hypothetical protein
VTFNYPPVIGKDEYLGSTTYVSSYVGDPAGVQPVNFSLTSPFPVTSLGDHAPNPPTALNLLFPWDIFLWTGFFANGSRIEVGNYTQRVAGLKPLGDPQNAEDWVVHVFPLEVLGVGSG